MEQKPLFDSRTIVALLVCLGIWWAWQSYLQKKYPDTMGGATATTEQNAAAPAGSTDEKSGAKTVTQTTADGVKTKVTEMPGSPAKLEELKWQGPEKTWTYDNDLMHVVVSSLGGRIKEVVLKKYQDNSGKAISMITPVVPGLLLTHIESSGAKLNAASASYELKALSDDTVQLSQNLAGVKVTKTFKFDPRSYVIKAKIDVAGELQNVSRVDVDSSETVHRVDEQTSKGLFSVGSSNYDYHELVFSHGTKLDREHFTATDKAEKSDKNFDQTEFAALGSRYFTTLLFNRANVIPTGRSFRDGETAILRMSYPVIDKSAPMNLGLDVYVGPKVLKEIERVDAAAVKVVDFGFFSIIALPLLDLLRWLYNLFQNWGVAIIVLTILVRLITFPFNYMSYKSMKVMQKIQPDIQRLREIYKDNPQTLNTEMIKLMRENKANPMGGCLPILLQLPVFWALYQVLQNSIELYHASFAWWIHDLSMKDPYFILPALMGLTMFIQQKITPTTMDPQQAKIMLIMPVMFTFLMLGLPSGLTLYIFVSTLFGIIQQFLMMKDGKSATGVPVVVRRT